MSRFTGLLDGQAVMRHNQADMSTTPIRLVFENDQHDASRKWQIFNEKSRPDTHQPSWVFLPEHGNDEDGYGYVTIAVFDPFSLTWTSWTGERVRPALWATIVKPELPLPPQDTVFNAMEQAKTYLRDHR